MSMFVRTLEEVAAAGRVFNLLHDHVRSARFINAGEGLGFSYNYSRVRAVADETLWYKNHWEANYIISGRGEVTDLTTGQSWPMEAGVLYVVGPNDRHRWHILEDERHVSIFCPPLRGDERHDEDGSFAANGPRPQTDRRMFVKHAGQMRAAGEEISVAKGQARTLRMLTTSDDVGFGFSDVHLDAGAEATLWYRHHWVANHVISGTGEVTDLATGQSWRLEPETAYIVGPKDRHRVRAHTEIHAVSIISPPLNGDERHDAEGTLPPSGPVPAGPPNG
jgi:L-ectoine synthase